MEKVVPQVTLYNGTSMPQYGLGTWKSKPGEVSSAVKFAISAGYRLIDCAYIYGNEGEVGEGIAASIKGGDVKREDLFIISKVWNTFHSREAAKEGVRQSLDSLATPYIDLMLVHWPMGYQEGGEKFPKDENGKFIYSGVDYLDTWKGMEDCVKSGQVKAIGLSNFNSDQVQRVIDNSEIKPALLQVECHPYLSQRALLDFCKERDIVFMAYSPLGSPDRPWAKPGDPSLLEDSKIVKIAEKYKKSPAQVLIRFQLDRGAVVVAKSSNPKRIEENMNIFDFTLSGEDVSVIEKFNREHRFVLLEWINDHPYYPFK